MAGVAAAASAVVAAAAENVTAAEAPGAGREDGATLNALVDNHRRFLAFLEKRVGSKEEAEDILQDGFARALERADEVRQEGSIIPWFYRLLRNAVTDHYRHRGAESRAMERAAGMEETSTALDDRELHDTVCGCVLGLMETLKPEYAAVLKEVELEEKPLTDYAKRVGITPGNAAVRVHRAREALRKQVIRTCGICGVHGCEDCACRRTQA
jgi:RNA polymerase sigma-70 factor (ECF subfamily)